MKTWQAVCERVTCQVKVEYSLHKNHKHGNSIRVAGDWTLLHALNNDNRCLSVACFRFLLASCIPLLLCLCYLWANHLTEDWLRRLHDCASFFLAVRTSIHIPIPSLQPSFIQNNSRTEVKSLLAFLLNVAIRMWLSTDGRWRDLVEGNDLGWEVASHKCPENTLYLENLKCIPWSACLVFWQSMKYPFILLHSTKEYHVGFGKCCRGCNKRFWKGCCTREDSGRGQAVVVISCYWGSCCAFDEVWISQSQE